MNKMYSIGCLKDDGKFTSEATEDDLCIAYILAHRLSLLRANEPTYTAVTFHMPDAPLERVVVFYKGNKIFEGER